MSYVISYHRLGWVLFPLIAVALILALGCAAGNQPAAGNPAKGDIASSPSVGHSVGDRILPFTVRLADGRTVRSDEILREAKPTFLFFFKPGCSVCFAESRRLKDIYPEYADRVDFLALSYSPLLEVDHDEGVWQEEKWPWLIGEPMGTMARDYRVAVSSTKIAFDSRGVIIYRAGFGQSDDEEFRRVFVKLAASR